MTVQGTPDWLAERREYVGASELAAILGRDPYRSEFELALEKKGQSAVRESSWPMAWGSRVQRLGIEVYSELTGRKVRNVTTTSVNKRWPHVRASLDGRVVREPVGVEVKWTSRTVREPTEAWRLQVQGQMGICDLRAVDIIRLSGRDEPAIWTVERDEAVIDGLLDMAEEWYVRFIVGDELPPVDGSRVAGRYLDSLAGEDIPMLASVEQDALVARLGALERAKEQAEAEAELVKNQIKESMVGSYRLEGRGYRVTWKPTKERTTVDWKSVAEAHRQTLLLFAEATGGGDAAARGLDDIQERHTTTGEGTRPFRVWLDREDAA